MKYTSCKKRGGVHETGSTPTPVYDDLPKAIGFDDKLDPYRRFVFDEGSTEAGQGITAKTGHGKGGKKTRRWIDSLQTASRHTPRKTPSSEVVGRILNQLRTGGKRPGSRRNTRWAARERQIVQERDWLMGRLAAQAGLRSGEIASLHLDDLRKALDAAELRIDWPKPPASIHVLDLVAGNAATREKIISGLRLMIDNKHTSLGVEVRGKGRGTEGKLRVAPFPIELVIDLLDIAVWEVRKQLLRNWSNINARYQLPNKIFLSHKTKRALGAGAIGDVFKTRFPN